MRSSNQLFDKEYFLRLLSEGRKKSQEAVDRLVQALYINEVPLAGFVAVVGLWRMVGNRGIQAIRETCWTSLHEFTRYAILSAAIEDKDPSFVQKASTDLDGLLSVQYRVHVCDYLLTVNRFDLIGAHHSARITSEVHDETHVRMFQDPYVPDPSYRNYELLLSKYSEVFLVLTSLKPDKQ